MKKIVAALLALLLLFALAGCGKEEELEPWTMPAVDTKPTPVPTQAPSFGVTNPERIVWNEAAYLNMNQPGAAPGSVQETLTHRQCAALFPYNFLPAAVFGLLATQTPGKGGEIQLTDAIRRFVAADGSKPILAHVYAGKRQDIGNPRGYFEALKAMGENE